MTTYGSLTLLSAALMLVGWLGQLGWRAKLDWLIMLGVGLLLLTPLLVLLQLAYLTRHTDRLVARYSLIVVVLVGLALVIGLLWGGIR